MLIGEYKHTIDTKGRVNFPAKLREVLGESFVICKGLGDKCLCVYSFEEWENLEQKIKNLPLSKARVFQRFLFAGAVKATPDKQGRVILPSNLREYGLIDKEVIIVGASTRAEIWDRSLWEENCLELTPELIEDVMNEIEF